MAYSIIPPRRKFKLSVTSILIIINVVVFLGLIIAGFSDVNCGNNVCRYVALQPSSVLQGNNIWTLLTSIFVHANFTHILFNMISLFFVGTLLERILGRRRFLAFYLLSGLFASIVFTLLAGFLGGSLLGGKLFGDPSVFGVGASGAIFGLVGVLAVLTPKNKISLIAGPLIAIILDSVIASAFPNSGITSALSIIFTIYVFFSIFAMFSFNKTLYKFAIPLNMSFWLLPVVAIVPLVIIGLFVELPIANSAHFGGLIAGVAYGFYLRHKFPRKTKMISKLFSK